MRSCCLLLCLPYMFLPLHCTCTAHTNTFLWCSPPCNIALPYGVTAVGTSGFTLVLQPECARRGHLQISLTRVFAACGKQEGMCARCLKQLKALLQVLLASCCCCCCCCSCCLCLSSRSHYITNNAQFLRVALASRSTRFIVQHVIYCRYLYAMM
jgi:hypothetical protein